MRELENSGASATDALLSVTNLNEFNGPHQTTNLGVSGSNPFGRAIFRDIPCDSHGNRTTQGTVPAQKSIRSRNLFAGNAARPGFLPGPAASLLTRSGDSPDR